MATIKCPQCKKEIGIKNEGEYLCPECESRLSYRNKKTSVVIAGNSINKLGNLAPLLWVASILGIFLSMFVMIASFAFGSFLLALSVLTLPPVISVISRKTNMRIRYLLLILLVVFVFGSGYSLNRYSGSDEYKEAQSKSIEDGRLQEERDKRLKAESEKENLEMMIVSAKEINEDYPEEVDGVKTSVLSAQDANLKIINAPEGKLYDVIQVVDGDTIKVSELGTLRLIGIDTPETVDPRKPVQCFGKEASNKAKELLSGKKVKLEFDESQGRIDKYGRTLTYVFVEDGTFFNLEMIKQGYAHEYTYSTPYKYQSEFKRAQTEAQIAKIGLWGNACSCEKGAEVSRTCTECNQLTVKKYNWDCSTYTEKVSSNTCSSKCTTSTPVAPKPSSSYTCNCSKTCSQITSCSEAQYQLKTCGCSARDGDDDGIACDSMCQ